MGSGGGPPDKWVAFKVSTTNDPAAMSADEVLEYLNQNYKVTGAFALACNDGNFVFIGYYSQQ